MTAYFRFVGFFAGLIPIIALFSGQALVPILILLGLYPFYKFFKDGGYKNLEIPKKFDLQSYAIILPIGFLFLACFVSHNVAESLELYFRILFLLFLFYVIFNYVQRFNIFQSQVIIRNYFIGFNVALLLFFIEKNTNAAISEFLVGIISPEKSFDPDARLILIVNRGLCFLVMSIWPIVAFGFANGSKRDKILLSFSFLLLFFAVFYADSETAKLALLATGFIYLFTKIFAERFIKLLMVGFCLVCITLPLFLGITNPQKISEKTGLQFSAVHRLCIWKYISGLIAQQPYGYGFDASQLDKFNNYAGKKVCVVSNDLNQMDEIYYHISHHPHNNIMQILFELGFIGLFIYIFIFEILLLNIHNMKISKRRKGMILGLLFAYFFAGFTGYGIWQN